VRCSLRLLREAFFYVNNSRSSTAIWASTTPKLFSSPQRVKARYFTWFTSAFECGESSILAIRTSNAEAASSPAPQIISVSASIFSAPGSCSLASLVAKNRMSRRCFHVPRLVSRVEQATDRLSPMRSAEWHDWAWIDSSFKTASALCFRALIMVAVLVVRFAWGLCWRVDALPCFVMVLILSSEGWGSRNYEAGSPEVGLNVGEYPTTRVSPRRADSKPDYEGSTRLWRSWR